MSACKECSREMPYTLSRGMCRRCYKAWKRATDPDYAARAREHSRAWKDRNREANRARDRATMHRPCPKCGGPMKRQRSQCKKCYDAEFLASRNALAAMWHDGATLAEIAAALDTTIESVGATMVRMRRAGWDLPYRYAMSDGRRVAA